MKAINYLVRENKSQTNEINSFIGGKPKLPPNMEIPKCKVCGEELTFLFQIAFPKEHSWHGKSMAVFMCIYNDETHDLIPQIVVPEGFDEKLNRLIINVDKSFLDEYEKFFSVKIYDTKDGIIAKNYNEQTAYKELTVEYSNEETTDETFVVAGKPIWIMGVDETPQSICNDTDVQLLFQIKEQYIFEKLEDAPEQIDADDETIGYDLFVANRIYFWGNSDINNPRVYISVQRP